MNRYIAGGLLATLLLVIILDKGRILKDLWMVACLLLVSTWAVILYGLISPATLFLILWFGPLFRWFGLWPKTGCTGVVWTKIMMSLVPRFGGKPNDTKDS